jgi:NAD(P)H dehydrogenase (quinone)
MPTTILITGASGQLGRRVIHHLLERRHVPPAQIIAATRSPEALADLAARGVAVRRADFDDQTSLINAFAGADTILIVSTDLIDLASGKRLRQHEAAVAAAKRAGVTHLAYTSMLRPEPGSPFLLAGDHFGTEQAIQASGIAHTIFRANAYFENLLRSLPLAVTTGRWYTSSGEGRVAYAARDDMAAAIAARLASGTGDSATLELTGPEAYRNADVARLVTEVTGRSIEIVSLTDDALVDHLKTIGVPEPFARLLASGEATVRAGDSDVVNDTIERLTGQKPLSLKGFLEQHRAVLLGQSG